MTSLPEKIIDFHVHLFPDKLFDAIWDYFDSVYQWNVIHKIYSDECIAYLNQRNVSHIVYSNYSHKPGVASSLNQWNESLLDKYPFLYCFAAYHPDDKDALDYAKSVLKHPRVLGFKLQLLVQNFFPHDERLYPLYELMIEMDKRILFHVGTGPAGNDYVGYEYFEKVLKRYPDLPANVAHMGGFEYKEFMDLLEDHPNLILDTSFSFYPELEFRFNLEPDYLERHQNQIVYGSDFPNLIYPRENEIKTLLDYTFSADFYEKVFYENGKRILQRHSSH